MRRIPKEALVLVADGASARLFRNLGSETGAVKLHQEESLTLDPAEGEMPAVLPADVPPKEVDEASFARQLAKRLNEDALGGRYAHLVLVAEPQTLGQIRPLLHEETKARVAAELAKNFTNARREDIERALAPEF
ncbi:host attachment protein [Xanthomonas sp. XNM01]|uniref:baeRF12 domain-containing protein n=1 Tax=Xanthomonas sp. XNM01 TaxID=2769289 RepID=UPI001780E79F|nr:host attachment protein [Xanthomonas sp. XNM01]MBD9371008.1 host attachment protein [Xanthomonas sp. XNM01]